MNVNEKIYEKNDVLKAQLDDYNSQVNENDSSLETLEKIFTKENIKNVYHNMKMREEKKIMYYETSLLINVFTKSDINLHIILSFDFNNKLENYKIINILNESINVFQEMLSFEIFIGVLEMKQNHYQNIFQKNNFPISNLNFPHYHILIKKTNYLEYSYEIINRIWEKALKKVSLNLFTNDFLLKGHVKVIEFDSRESNFFLNYITKDLCAFDALKNCYFSTNENHLNLIIISGNENNKYVKAYLLGRETFYNELKAIDEFTQLQNYEHLIVTENNFLKKNQIKNNTFNVKENIIKVIRETFFSIKLNQQAEKEKEKEKEDHLMFFNIEREFNINFNKYISKLRKLFFSKKTDSLQSFENINLSISELINDLSILEKEKIEMRSLCESFFEEYIRYIINRIGIKLKLRAIIKVLGINFNLLIIMKLIKIKKIQPQNKEINFRNAFLSYAELLTPILGRIYFDFFSTILKNFFEIKSFKTIEKNKLFPTIYKEFFLTKSIKKNEKLLARIKQVTSNELKIDPYLFFPPAWIIEKDKNQCNNFSGGHYLNKIYPRNALLDSNNEFNSYHELIYHEPELGEIAINNLQNQEFIINEDFYKFFYFAKNKLRITKIQLDILKEELEQLKKEKGKHYEKYLEKKNQYAASCGEYYLQQTPLKSIFRIQKSYKKIKQITNDKINQALNNVINNIENCFQEKENKKETEKKIFENFLPEMPVFFFCYNIGSNKRIKGLQNFCPLNSKINRALLKSPTKFPLSIIEFISHLILKYTNSYKSWDDIFSFYNKNFSKILSSEEILTFFGNAKEKIYFLAAILENNKYREHLNNYGNEKFYFTGYLIDQDLGASFYQIFASLLKNEKNKDETFLKQILKGADIRFGLYEKFLNDLFYYFENDEQKSVYYDIKEILNSKINEIKTKFPEAIIKFKFMNENKFHKFLTSKEFNENTCWEPEKKKENLSAFDNLYSNENEIEKLQEIELKKNNKNKLLNKKQIYIIPCNQIYAFLSGIEKLQAIKGKEKMKNMLLKVIKFLAMKGAYGGSYRTFLDDIKQLFYEEKINNFSSSEINCFLNAINVFLAKDNITKIILKVFKRIAKEYCKLNLPIPLLDFFSTLNFKILSREKKRISIYVKIPSEKNSKFIPKQTFIEIPLYSKEAEANKIDEKAQIRALAPIKIHQYDNELISYFILSFSLMGLNKNSIFTVYDCYFLPSIFIPLLKNVIKLSFQDIFFDDYKLLKNISFHNYVPFETNNTKENLILNLIDYYFNDLEKKQKELFDNKLKIQEKNNMNKNITDINFSDKLKKMELKFTEDYNKLKNTQKKINKTIEKFLKAENNLQQLRRNDFINMDFVKH